mgnify:FL=1
MADLSLAQIYGATRDPEFKLIADTLIKNDQVLGNIPLKSTGTQSVFGYRRKIANSTTAFIARGGSMSSNVAYKEVQILAKTRRIYDQQGVDRSDAGDAGGLVEAKAKRAASSLASLALLLGEKIWTGAQNVTGTLVGAALTVANGFSITNVGPHVIADRGPWLFKYTHTGTLVQVKAPNDPDYGTAVTVGTNTVAKVYSYNADSWVEVTHGSQAMSANDSGTIVMSGSSEEFDGVIEMLAGQTDRIIYAGDNGGALTMAMLDQLIGMVKGESRANIRLCLAEKSFRAYMALVRATGGGITMMDLAGAPVPSHAGVPILVTDNMPTTRTRGSASGVCTAAFATTFGEDGGLMGYYTDDPGENEPNATVFNKGPMGLTVWDLGMSGTAHNSTIRTVCHFALGLPNTAKIAMLDGITGP